MAGETRVATWEDAKREMRRRGFAIGVPVEEWLEICRRETDRPVRVGDTLRVVLEGTLYEYVGTEIMWPDPDDPPGEPCDLYVKLDPVK
jgi:hypothetical protein